MASFTAEQFNALLAALKTPGSGGAGGGGGGGGGRILDRRNLRNQDFDGNQEKWGDWAFGLKRSIRSGSQDMFRMMELVEQGTTEPDEDQMNIDNVDMSIDRMSAELFDVLCQQCCGDAMSVVRSVDGCGGFVAWFKLHRKYNPRTMARAIRLMGEVTNPPPVRDLREVDAALAKWEQKVKTLRSEFGENPSNTMRIAIVTGMMPPAIQDFIYTNVDEKALCEAVIEKIRSITGNKVAMMEPTPMDVGEVWADGNDYGEEEDVGAVGAHVRCHKCEGWGHMSRECPTQSKGKGKGKAAYSKGDGKAGKGGSKGGGKSGKGPAKGGGKGYQGECWKCGKVGHKSAECWGSGGMQVDAVTEEDDDTEIADVSGVWMIGAVDATEEVDEEKEWKEKKKKTKNVKEVFVNHVAAEAKKLTRQSGMCFHVARVQKPLASAAKVVAAGNRIVMVPDGGESFIENIASGERLAMRVERGTYVFDVEYEDGEEGSITLDSGAGVNVWPMNLQKKVPMMAKQKGLKMMAANGTEIENMGRKMIKFRGVAPVFTRRT
jgi:hypothetical protein